jgi:hypothetical protein
MPSDDNYSHHAPGLSSPATNGEAVTPSDSASFTKASRALYVGGAGTVVAVMKDGTTLTFVGVPAGAILPIRATRVNSTSTTATNIVALY